MINKELVVSHLFKKAYLVLSHQDWDLLKCKVNDFNKSFILCAHPSLSNQLRSNGFVAASFGEFFLDEDHFNCLNPLDLFSKKLESVAESSKVLHSIKHYLIYYSHSYLSQAFFCQSALYYNL